jgi:hypothetical protein
LQGRKRYKDDGLNKKSQLWHSQPREE